MAFSMTRSRGGSERGFTLIELLVVIIIIGILAAVAVPIFMNQRKRAADSATTADIRNLAHQLETYYVSNLTYPLALDGVQNSAEFTIGSDPAVLSPGVTTEIIIGTGSSVGHYAICGWNSYGKAATRTNAWVWNSAQGGMQSLPGSCPSGNALV